MAFEPIQEPEVGTVYGPEELEAVRQLLFSGTTLNRGRDVTAFEEEFAAYCQAPHAVAVSSCTAALRLAMQVAGLKEGDEIIVQANAFWNAVVPLVERKVKVHFADVEGYGLTMDPGCAEALIKRFPRVKALLCFSHGGRPCRMDQLRAICDRHGLILIEDAAHAAGASFQGKKSGAWADITCFSFSTLKNISTLGEGGMLVTLHQKFSDKARKLRECWPVGETVPAPKDHFGEYPKPVDASFMHPGDAFISDWTRLDEVGTNYKMSSIEAAVGRIQLKRLDDNIAKRAAVAKHYSNFLSGSEGFHVENPAGDIRHAHHLYNFFVLPSSGLDRNEFVLSLKQDAGIRVTNRFWPTHLHSVFRMHGHGIGEAPVLERIWFKEQVALPLSPAWGMDKVNRILDGIKLVRQKFLETRKARV